QYPIPRATALQDPGAGARSLVRSASSRIYWAKDRWSSSAGRESMAAAWPADERGPRTRGAAGQPSPGALSCIVPGRGYGRKAPGTGGPDLLGESGKI